MKTEAAVSDWRRTRRRSLGANLHASNAGSRSSAVNPAKSTQSV